MRITCITGFYVIIASYDWIWIVHLKHTIKNFNKLQELHYGSVFNQNKNIVQNQP